MNTPRSVDFGLCELRAVKMKGSTGSERGYADLTLRVGLGEDFDAAVSFLAHVQEGGKPVAVTIAELQGRLSG